MADRKHMTEIALNFCSGGLLLLHPKDIKKFDSYSKEIIEIAELCHIYLVVDRPRISFVPGSIDVGKEKTSGKFCYVESGEKREVRFFLKGEANADSIEISDYPHTRLSLIRDNEKIFTAPAHLLSMICDYVDDPSIRDLEVLYVGKSYADGTRSAKDRLLRHSTLQQVLADLNNESPDMEALIIMVQYFPPQTLISFDPTDENLNVENDRDIVADLEKQQVMISEDLEISLIEAGLIKYFEPPYNEKYKKRFPHPNHKILKEVYEIDFSGLVVELNTEEINGRLYSKVRGPGYHHTGSIDLHDPTERRSFFNIMNLDEGSDAADFSGPVF